MNYITKGIFDAAGNCRCIHTASSIEELEAQLREGEHLGDPPVREDPHDTQD